MAETTPHTTEVNQSATGAAPVPTPNSASRQPTLSEINADLAQYMETGVPPKSKRWVDTPEGRIGLMMTSRLIGCVGFALTDRWCLKHLSQYNHGQHLDHWVNRFSGFLTKLHSPLYGDEKVDPTQSSGNTGHFDGGNHDSGQKWFYTTVPFFMGGVFNGVARNILLWFDPAEPHEWKKDKTKGFALNNIDWNKFLSVNAKVFTRYFLRNNLEDIPASSFLYTDVRRGTAATLGHLGQPQYADSYNMNGLEKMRPHIVAHTLDIGVGFAWYNVITKMWRDFYDATESKLGKAWNAWRHPESVTPPTPEELAKQAADAKKNIFEKTGEGIEASVKYVFRTVTKMMGLMLIPAHFYGLTSYFTMPRHFKSDDTTGLAGYELRDLVAGKKDPPLVEAVGNKVTGNIAKAADFVQTSLGLQNTAPGFLREWLGAYMRYAPYFAMKQEFQKKFDTKENDQKLDAVFDRFIGNPIKSGFASASTFIGGVGHAKEPEKTVPGETPIPGSEAPEAKHAPKANPVFAKVDETWQGAKQTIKDLPPKMRNIMQPPAAYAPGFA